MTARIKEFVRVLESKVEHRTDELKTANENFLREIDDWINVQENLQETQAGIVVEDAQTGDVKYINEVGMVFMGESKETITHDFNVFT